MCLRIKCEFIAVYAKSTCLVNGNGTAHRGMMIFCVRDMTNLLLSHIISSLCHISIQSLSVYSPDVWKIKVPLLIFLIACTKKVQNFFLLQVSFIVTLTAVVCVCAFIPSFIDLDLRNISNHHRHSYHIFSV